MSKLSKVRQLIAMAMNEGTTPEEARTFAFTAVSIIVSEGLEIRDASLVGGGPSQVSLDDLLRRGEERIERERGGRRWPDAGPTPRARPVAREKPGGDRMITTKTAGFCAECRDAFPRGERVVWRGATSDLVHVACHGRDGVREDSPG